MPTLNWIGKDAVVNHHRHVPYRLLHCDKPHSAGDPDAGNLLVQGDNLEALKALLPYYAGKVKCIYIDPPYNTGKEGWIYNDNVNSPQIRKWLGSVVGKEAEDLTRHDKWLCMMYPRLSLLREFLSDDGVMFMSIDDNELHHARAMLDELFRVKNMLACITWQTDGNFDNQARIKIVHEYVLAYAKDERNFDAPQVIDPSVSKGSKLFNAEIRNTVVKNGPGNPVSEFVVPQGFPASFEAGTIVARRDKWPQYEEDVIVKDYKTVNSVTARSGWSSKRIMQKFVTASFEMVEDTKGQLTSFEVIPSGAIEAVKKRPETQSHVISVLREVGTVQGAAQMLEDLSLKFPYAKPAGLIQYLTSMVAGDTLILDSFAGSGTTGHAVFQMNKADGGNRRFICIEMDETIARDVTAQRLKKVVEGYTNAKGEAVEGLGGGFRYCTLGKPLFDEYGSIDPDVTFADLAAHVFFTETGSPIPKRATGKSPLLGVHGDAAVETGGGRAVYLLFNGVLGDRRPAGGNVLTRAVLEGLPPHPNESPGGGPNALPRVVYGEACRLSPATLAAANVTFKQVPWEVKVG